MIFKDTEYGDLKGKTCYKNILIINKSKFTINYNKNDFSANQSLTSLDGSPKIMKKTFDISFNEINSLEYSPEIVHGNFNCSNNILKSLKFGPKIVNQDYFCSNNNLISLEGSPEEIGGGFYCHSNNKLSSLEYRPKIIKKTFNCINNPELKNVKKQIIKYQIKAREYWTDEGNFKFDDIKEEFYLYRKNKQEKINKEYKKKIFNQEDYGISL